MFGKIGNLKIIKMESYSQCGQDLFVASLLKGGDKKFLDLGCYLPKKINNTYLLELNGWDGVSVDIIDYSEEWKNRKTPFLQQDCFNIDFNSFLSEHYSNKTIDYLSLDMEKVGDRYKLLEKVLLTDYEFKIITIEHDSYLGEQYVKNEKEPQREMLKRHGYTLLCSDVAHWQSPEFFYEDWWINKKYFNEDEITPWFSDRMSCNSIFHKVGVEYNINEISKNW